MPHSKPPIEASLSQDCEQFCRSYEIVRSRKLGYHRISYASDPQLPRLVS
jgi:hypothetical protein